MADSIHDFERVFQLKPKDDCIVWIEAYFRLWELPTGKPLDFFFCWTLKIHTYFWLIYQNKFWCEPNQKGNSISLNARFRSFVWYMSVGGTLSVFHPFVFSLHLLFSDFTSFTELVLMIIIFEKFTNEYIHDIVLFAVCTVTVRLHEGWKINVLSKCVIRKKGRTGKTTSVTNCTEELFTPLAQ